MSIRYGNVDRHDPITGRCTVSPMEPLDLMVHGHAVASFTTCPRRSIPTEIWELITYAEFAREGHWPIAGGLLDQSHSFVIAARFVWNEIDRIKAQQP